MIIFTADLSKRDQVALVMVDALTNEIHNVFTICVVQLDRQLNELIRVT